MIAALLQRLSNKFSHPVSFHYFSDDESQKKVRDQRLDSYFFILDHTEGSKIIF